MNAVALQGTRGVSESDVKEKIATVPSPRFLGIWPGVVFDYELFDPHVLQRDLERIVRYYRARGFYEARVRVGRVEPIGRRSVRVRIIVDEGKPVLLRSVRIHGLETVPRAIADEALAAVRAKLPPGSPFEEDKFQAGEAAIQRALADRGYALAKVERNARVDLSALAADAEYRATPGSPCSIGHVSVEGLGKLPEAPVRRALALHEGSPYSESALEAAQQSVLNLGVFSSVEVHADVDHPQSGGRVPIAVRVVPAKLRTLALGGGLELDVIRTSIHLLASWEDRNFFGGMRNLAVRFRPGTVLYPTRIPDLQKPDRLLPEERFRMDFRQPGFLEARTNALLRGEYNVFPVLLVPQIGTGTPVLGYREARASAGVERTLWRFYLNPTYNVQANTPFTYVGPLDPTLGSVLVSYINLVTRFDLRNDPIRPHRGLLVGNELQLAGLGGDARDVRVQPEFRGYLPMGKRVTLAVRGSIGFLFPGNYGKTLASNAGGGQPASDGERAQWAHDAQLVYFRGFFSGGASSNRGYPLRGVGPHGVLPFFTPGIATAQLAAATASNVGWAADLAKIPGGCTRARS